MFSVIRSSRAGFENCAGRTWEAFPDRPSCPRKVKRND